MKYCMYGFSLIISTSFLSERFTMFCIIRLPRAILTDIASFPLIWLLKFFIYFSSTSAQGMIAASLHHLFWGFRFPLNGRKNSCGKSICFSLCVYILDSPSARFFGVFSDFPCTYYIINVLVTGCL